MDSKRKKSTGSAISPRPELELHHHTCREPGLVAAKVREPNAALRPAHCCGARQISRSRRQTRHAREKLRIQVVATRRRYAASPREVRNIGMAISGLQPPSDVRSGHVLHVNCAIPHFCRQARSLGEVRRAAEGRGAVDGRQQR